MGFSIEFCINAIAVIFEGVQMYSTLFVTWLAFPFAEAIILLFLHVERHHLHEGWAQNYAQIQYGSLFQHCRDIPKHSDCSVILWSAGRLFIATTKTEERYIAKATNSQYFTQLFTQKVVLLFAFSR